MFTHLHVHTQFSLLDGAAGIEPLIKKAKENNMNSLAITDHGNMYGVLNFVKEANKNNIKPIIGCETYVAHNSRLDKKSKEDRSGYHLILLVKNKAGYSNLTKLMTLAHKEGQYYKPRIDKELLKKYHEGLIASSACLGGEIPYFIRNFGIEEACKRLESYLDIFKDDFYLELQRHGLEEQKVVNKALLEMAKKYNVKTIATNDVHFVNKEDSEAHNILIRLNTNKDDEDEQKMRYSGEEYLKTSEEMYELFSDIPEVAAMTQELADSIESFSLNRDVILPVFPIPEGFENENEYLRHLTEEGAKNKYEEITEEVRNRIDRELSTVFRMGFSGYFLIVQDFIREAKRLGVIVGPGRGSAAGSIIAYCVGITNIDPIKYNLLFERFLNPERISMPDIDVDFDDEKRDKVLEYVVNKYGEDNVSQIITFGTMGPKLAIKDVARVLELPLAEANKLTKLVPDTPGLSFKLAYESSEELAKERKEGSKEVKKVLALAEVLEGSIRHYGTHACGVIISKDKLIDYVPLCTAKDGKLMITQYDGKLVESIGLLKMDFLGLKTLTIMKDALENIKKKHGIEIDVDKIPFDDKKTFNLFKKGDTIGVFQFESEGMRLHLKNLKPTSLEDLIAMNALFRPGPMNHIPSFINRKQGKEKISYPHPILEEILKPTYGIMVYQEQIMQISQRMAGFSGAKADELRKAMGKKIKRLIEELKVEFVEGAKKNGIEEKNAEEVYELMAKFGQYGFNRSHSAAYSVVAYQTAYLKAHYPAEYMSAILTSNINDIKKITFYLSECKRQDLKVLGPDINESSLKFSVNSKGEIRFGLAAVKNVGEGVVNELIEEREKNGYFKSIFDLVKRVSTRSLNKKGLESLILAGAMDSFPDTHRAQFFYKNTNEELNFLEKVLKNAGNYQNGLAVKQASLFGEEENAVETLSMPECDAWSTFELLQKEKEITGFYISGHPLFEFNTEMETYCNTSINKLQNNEDLKKIKGQEVRFAGIITSSIQKTTKKGDPFGNFTIEDYNDSIGMNLFKEDYLKFRHLLLTGQLVYVRAKIQERFTNDDTYELRVSEICLLSDVLEKYSKCVTVILGLNEITKETIKKLKEIIKKNKGSKDLKFTIIDEAEGNRLELHSKKSKVNIQDFIKEINKSLHFEYKIS